MVRGPSIESLRKKLKLKKIEAKSLKEHMNELDPERTMKIANKYMRGYGVEAVRDENIWIGHYWQNTGLLYVNKGDTYDTTLVYDTEKNKFDIMSWGDWAERNIL